MRTTKKILSMILAFVLVLGLLPTTAFATENDEFTVVVSVEGLTIGQGLYVEPTAYTLDEINALLAQKGYGPYTEETLTASLATVAMFIDKGLEFQYTGEPDADFYLSQIKDIDKGEYCIPDVIWNNGNPDDWGNDDEWLGEFDYAQWAGWMITVNHYLINFGSSAWDLVGKKDQGNCQDYGNTYVIRWQFSVSDMGSDLGFPSFSGVDPYFDAANKDLLYATYAMSDDDTAKAAARQVMEKLDATQEEVDAALNLFAMSEPEPEPEPEPVDRVAQSVTAQMNAVMAQLAADIPAPAFGTNAGEWTVLTLARGGYYTKDNSYFADYYDRIVATVNEKAASINLNGVLDKAKSTENSRLILALSAIGKDATSVGDWNLIKPFEDFNFIKKQGINGPVYALLALDSHNYQTENTTIREQCIQYILDKKIADGGWALSGNIADPDITAMTLQALAPYRNQPAVAEAAEAAFAKLSEIQGDNGGYTSWGSVNSESCAQVVVACASWGINPDTDARFVKNGKSVVDALLAHYLEEEARFQHIIGDGANGMATDQAAYALVAYDRLVNGKTSLYDYSDVIFDEPAPSGDEVVATLGLPAEINPGAAFNATVSINKWDNEAGYKLIDLIVNIPEGVSVTGVTASSRLEGGAISWNVEEETGKLRIVYFDANENKSLTITGEEFPVELFTIGLKADSVAGGSKVNVAISGMSVKLTSDSEDDASMEKVNTDTAKDTTDVVVGISFSAKCLYTGDDVDIIPSTKKAVAVAITGIAKGAKLTFKDGETEIIFQYSKEITEKTGVSTYVALVDAEIDMAKFIDEKNFTIAAVSEETAITFGDANGDGVVNAEDALAAVNTWLRVGEEPTDIQILTMNVNGDSRINTYDALGIVEAFVNKTDYIVVTKAATITENQ